MTVKQRVYIVQCDCRSQAQVAREMSRLRLASYKFFRVRLLDCTCCLPTKLVKSVSLCSSNRDRSICSKWTLTSLIFNVRFADYSILLATSADNLCSIAFIVSFITSAVVTGIRNLPGLKCCQRKRISSYVCLTAEVALGCIAGVLDIKM